MAFSQINLKVDRSVYNTSSPSEHPAFHQYASPDTLEEMEASGYFPPWFGYDHNTVSINDILTAYDTTDLLAESFLITSVNPMILSPIGEEDPILPPIPPEPIYQRFPSFAYTTTWLSSGGTIDISFQLSQNNIVLFMVNTPFFFFVASGGGTVTFTTPIPTTFRPTSTKILRVPAVILGPDLGTDAVLFQITTSGILTISQTNQFSPNFTFNDNVYIGNVSGNYSIV
jgi:hypothetical protein